MRISPIGGLGVRWQADYDPRVGRIVDSSFAMDYHFAKYFVSAGHNMVNTDPAITAAANHFRLRAGFGDPKHRGHLLRQVRGVEGVYDAYRTTSGSS